MSGYQLDLATPLCVAWSLGSAQVTYPIVGSILLGVATVNSCRMLNHKYAEEHTLGRCWKPLGLATLCLVPVVGGVLAAKSLGE